MRPFVGRRVLEVGAGHRAPDPLPVDARARPRDRARSGVRRAPAPDLRQRPERRGPSLDLAHLADDGIPRQGFDTVVCSNVLEHVADDRGALDAMRDVLVPGRAGRAHRAGAAGALRLDRPGHPPPSPLLARGPRGEARGRRARRRARQLLQHARRPGLVPERPHPATTERARRAGPHRRLAGPVAAAGAPLRTAGRACRCWPSRAPGSHRAWPARVAAAEAASPARRQSRKLACRVERRQLLEAADRFAVDEDLRHGPPAGPLDQVGAQLVVVADVDLARTGCRAPRGGAWRARSTEQLGVV